MIRRAVRLGLLGVWATLLPAAGAAQAPEVEVQASPSAITVGDRVVLDVTVTHTPGDSIVWPEITDPMGSFDVLEAEAVRPVVEDGRQRSVLRITLTAFELGDLEFPSVSVGVVAPDGGQTTLETDPVTIRVQTIGLDEGDEIRDIKPPISIPRNWLLLLPWILAVLAAIALAYWTYRRYRRRQRPAHQPPHPPSPPRPPHEIALEAFARLRASPLLERGEVKQYFVEASEILRRYVEGRFDVEAMELPSGDILGGLRAAGVRFEPLEQFREFFRRADLVKFAKVRPAPEVSVRIVDLGEGIVRAAGAAGAAGSAGAAGVSASPTSDSSDLSRSSMPSTPALPAEPAPPAEAGRGGERP